MRYDYCVIGGGIVGLATAKSSARIGSGSQRVQEFGVATQLPRGMRITHHRSTFFRLHGPGRSPESNGLLMKVLTGGYLVYLSRKLSWLNKPDTLSPCATDSRTRLMDWTIR
jgi:hypothetical protein